MSSVDSIRASTCLESSHFEVGLTSSGPLDIHSTSEFLEGSESSEMSSLSRTIQWQSVLRLYPLGDWSTSRLSSSLSSGKKIELLSDLRGVFGLRGAGESSSEDSIVIMWTRVMTSNRQRSCWDGVQPVLRDARKHRLVRAGWEMVQGLVASTHGNIQLGRGGR
jgi:hypothetical protein